MKTLRSYSVVVILLAFTISACASLNTPIDGVVIDTATSKPIAGAFVIVSWHARGSDGYGSRSSCPHMDIVRSDAEGRYRLPAQPYTDSENTQRSIFAYVPGYDKDYTSPREAGRLNMKHFTGTGDERMQRFNTYWSLFGCGPREGKYQRLSALYTAIDNETKTLTLAPKDPSGTYTFMQALDDWRDNYDKDGNRVQKGKK